MYHFFKATGLLVLGVKFMEINSNLFSRQLSDSSDIKWCFMLVHMAFPRNRPRVSNSKQHQLRGVVTNEPLAKRTLHLVGVFNPFEKIYPP